LCTIGTPYVDQPGRYALLLLFCLSDGDNGVEGRHRRTFWCIRLVHCMWLKPGNQFLLDFISPRLQSSALAK